MYYSTGKFAKFIGVTATTLRNWEKQGILIPAFKTPNGERKYSEEQLQQILQNKSKYRVVTAQFVRNIFNETKEQDKDVTPHKDAITSKDETSQHTKTIKANLDTKEYNKPNESQSRLNIGYARVSSKEQEEELKRQVDLLELFLVKQGKPFKIISDIGSGIDYSKLGLNELLKLISSNQVDTVYILYKDRLVRFGFKLIEEFAKYHNTKIEVINQTENKIDKEEFVEDIVNIIQIFSYIFDNKLNGNSDYIISKIVQRLLDEREKHQ
ncbi:MAG: IS607 family transposase [Candidatus Nanopusillus acidilobi]